MQSTQEFSEAFRALRYDPNPSPWDIIHWIEEAAQHDPKTYQNIWVPYLESFDLPTLEFRSLTRAEALFPLLPTNVSLSLKIGTDFHKCVATATRDLAQSPILPHIRALSLRFDKTPENTAHEAIKHLLEQPALRSLQSFELRGVTLTVDLGNTLANAPALHKIRTLSLQRADIPLFAAHQLTRAPFWPHLHTLKLELTWRTGHTTEALLRHPGTSSLRCLEISGDGCLGWLHQDRISRFTHLFNNLQKLSLSTSGLTTRDLEKLVSYCTLPHLEELDLSGNTLSPKSIQTLSISTSMPSLKHLNLSSANLTPDDLRPLQDATSFPNLRSLNVSYSEIEDEGLQILLSSPWMKNLQHLGLESCETTPRIIPALIRTLKHNDIKHLNLGSNEIGNRGAALLSEAFPGAKISVQWGQIGPQGIKALVDACCILHHRRTLDLSHNPLGDQGAQLLPKMKNLNDVQHLLLRACALEDEAVQHIAHLPNRARITHLDLSHNQITPEGLQILLQEAPHFRRLQHLNLRHNPLGDQGAQDMAHHAAFPSLLTLDLTDCQFTPQGIQHLTASQHLKSLQKLVLDPRKK